MMRDGAAIMGQDVQPAGKKRLAFLLGITGNLGFAAGNVALGINKYMRGGDYDIVIYHSGLKSADAAAFERVPNVRLVPFEFRQSFVASMLERLPRQSRFKDAAHLMCFCHFEAFRLLREYENVVWLDADISIQASIDEITDFSPFGITSDEPWTVQNNFTHAIPGYDMHTLGVCTAVMAVNDTLPYEALYSWCYEKAVEYSRYLVNPDQGIINIALQEFGIDYKLMPLKTWQCISWRDEANVAKIVHFGTTKKVWNDPHLCNAFPEWYRTHLEWLRLGGSDFDQSKVQPKNVLSRLTEGQADTLADSASPAKSLEPSRGALFRFLKPRYLALGLHNSQPGTVGYLLHKSAMVMAAPFFGWPPSERARQPSHHSAPPPEVAVAIEIKGGLGDHVIAARFLRDLCARVGYFRFDIYSSRTEVAEWLFGSLPQLNRLYNAYLEWEANFRNYPLAMSITDFVLIHESSARWREAFKENRKLATICETIIRSRSVIEHHIDRHPATCHQLALEAVARKKNRCTLPHSLAGISYGGDLLDVDLDRNVDRRFRLPKDYITVHNGTDVAYMIDGRPIGDITSTKVYPHFAEVIAQLKEDLPDIRVVQLGGSNCKAITGIDLDLIGKTTLRETAGIIAGSRLHLDSEGGLVHLAASLGTKSCVIFGPTPADYFAYPSNINLEPLFCGNCWYIKGDWMRDCPRGYGEPRCLTTMPPKLVAEAMVGHLRGSGNGEAQSYAEAAPNGREQPLFVLQREPAGTAAST